MSGSSLTVPPPRDDDHDDVAWALRAASAQWRRDAVADAVGWVRRAAETAHEIGASQRAAELAQLANALSGGPVAAAPPPPRGALPSVGEVDIEVQMVDDDLDDLGDLDDLDDDVQELDDVDDVEDVDDVQELDDVDDVEDVDDVVDLNDEGIEAVDDVVDLDGDGVEEVTDDDEIVFDDLDDDSRSHETESRPRASAAVPRAPSAPTIQNRQPQTARRRTSTSSGIDLPPSMRPSPSGLDLDDVEEDDEFGELEFEDEVPTNRVNLSDGPPAPDLGDVRLDAPSAIPLETSTAAEYATSRGPMPTHQDHDDIEKELGVDLSFRSPGKPQPAEDRGRSSRQSSRPSAPRAPSAPVDVGHPRPSFGQSAAQEPAQDSVHPPRGAYEDAFDSAVSPVPGRASVRPSSVPGVARTTSADAEPYGLAPSAEMPPAEPSTLAAQVIEPPSKPTSAPPPAEMQEPDERPSQLPGVRPSGYPSAHGHPPPSTPALSNAPAPDEIDDMFAAISRPPPRPEQAHAAHAPAGQPQAAPEAPPVPGAMDDEAILVDGIDLMEIEGLQDLPDDLARELASTANLVTLERGQEVSSFGVALVTRGAVQLMPTVADAPCFLARKGDILFTKGTLDDEVAVRAVGFDPGSRVALFSKEALEQATSSSPWVADELAEVADKYLAFAGAVLGPLGHSLDDTFRFMVLEKCTVKSKAPGARVAEKGRPMDGMYILGGGTLELLGDDGSVSGQLGIGDFLFPETVLSASPASQSVRAGNKGALVLYADRMSAHELLATCPPLIELLAN